jgi:hypothetical protein
MCILEKSCVSKAYVKEAPPLLPTRQMTVLSIQNRSLCWQQESGQNSKSARRLETRAEFPVLITVRKHPF